MKPLVAVMLLSMALPVALSLPGPIYYGFSNGPYWNVVIWAATATVGNCWLSRRSLKKWIFSDASSSVIGQLVNLTAIVVSMSLCFLVGDSIVYFLVKSGTTITVIAALSIAALIAFWWWRLWKVVMTSIKAPPPEMKPFEGTGDSMPETRSYELNSDQVFEICQALKFHADALDHSEGSRAEVTTWAKQAASLWRLIDKFVAETPSLGLLPPGSPG